MKVKRKRAKLPKKKKETKKKKIPGRTELIDEVSYVHSDGSFGDFEVRGTANAWWKSQKKLTEFIKGKKVGLNDTEACYYAGITKGQLDYFVKEHPNFLEYFGLLPMHRRTKAKMTIFDDLGNVDTAKWLAETTMGHEFSKRTVTEHSGPGGGAIRYANLTEKEIDEKLKEQAEILESLKDA